MANRRAWESLSEPYRLRLQRKGVTEELYGSGASLKAARGHAVTPERPQRAFRNPDIYSDYLRRRVARGKFVPQGTLPTPRPTADDEHPDRPDIEDSIGWAGKETLDIIVFYRSAGGVENSSSGVMTVTSLNPDGSIREVRSFTYNQADFFDLIQLAKQRGYVTNVISLPHRDMAAIIA